jgi:hypothetical protein
LRARQATGGKLSANRSSFLHSSRQQQQQKRLAGFMCTNPAYYFQDGACPAFGAGCRHPAPCVINELRDGSALFGARATLILAGKISRCLFRQRHLEKASMILLPPA